MGAVPSSVVVLSAGWQRGWCTRRKRGPRGTRRRTPRWFHAVKAVRFLQQLRIAAPPTTDIHIRTIRHLTGGGSTETRPGSVAQSRTEYGGGSGGDGDDDDDDVVLLVEGLLATTGRRRGAEGLGVSG